jgi:hypothetical protein
MAAIQKVMGLRFEIYRDGRDELIAEFHAQEAAIEQEYEAQGINDLNAESDKYQDQATAVLDQIRAIRPDTLPSAIALLEWGWSTRTRKS